MYRANQQQSGIFAVGGPGIKMRLIAAGVRAAFDRLNVAEVCRPHPAQMDPREVEILLASLRRLFGRRKKEETRARAEARRAG